jgi:hypothetical protein
MLDAIGLGVLYRQWTRCFDIGLVRVPTVVGTESSLTGNVVLPRLAGWGGADGHTAVEGSFGAIKTPPAKQKVVPVPGASGKNDPRTLSRIISYPELGVTPSPSRLRNTLWEWLLTRVLAAGSRCFTKHRCDIPAEGLRDRAVLQLELGAAEAQ